MPSFTDATATDACDAMVAITSSDATTPGSCAGTSSVTRTWTATDDCGNTATCSRTITIQDVTPPTITCVPQTSPVNCPALPVFTPATATDACDAMVDVTSADNTTPGSCAQEYSVTRTWTAMDDCGNTATCSRTISVQDIVLPIALCADITVDLGSGGSNTIDPADLDGGSSDNCGPVTFSASQTTFDCDDAGVVVVTLTVTDACGNTSTCTANVTVTGGLEIDITRNDQAICSGEMLDYTISTSVAGNVTFDLVIDQDPTPNSAPEDLSDDQVFPIIIPGIVINSATPYQVNQIIQNFTGLFDRGRVNVSVVNVSYPSNPACTTADINGPYTFIYPKPQLDNPGDIAICSGETVDFDLDLLNLPPAHVSGSGFPVYINWTATSSNNGGGVSGASNGTIVLYDAGGNEIQGIDISQILTNLGGSTETVTYVITPYSHGFFQNDPTDDCAGDPITIIVTIDAFPEGNDVVLPVQCSEAPIQIDPQAYITNNVNSTFTWTAVYDMGLLGGVNSGSGPIIETLTNTSNGILNAVYTVTPTSFPSGCPGQPFTITLPVQTLSSITCPSDVTVNTSNDGVGNCTTDLTFMHPVPGGGCTPHTLSIDFDPGMPAPSSLPTGGPVTAGQFANYTFAAGQTIITYLTTDAANVVKTCVFTVTVNDDEDPTWVTADDVLDATLQCSDAAGIAAAQLSTPIAIDNCDFTLTPVKNAGAFVPGACPQAGTYTNTWTVTDDFGNTSVVYTQIITLEDTQAPVLSGVPANVTVQCGSVPPAEQATATDNCDNSVTPAFTETSVPGSCPDASVITRTWTATDDCGNSTSSVQVITVIDTQAPTLNGVPANVTVQCNAVPPAATVTATDNCDTDVTLTFGETTAPGSCPDSYTITRTWTASDNCGNSTQSIQTISVIDTQAPVFSGVPANVTVQCNSIPTAGQPTATDNCDASVTVTFNETTTPGNCPDSYTITRTWTATDNCGNSTQGIQTISVVDTQAPVLSGIPANVTVQCDGILPPATPTATDNCDQNVTIALVETTTPGNCPDSYSLTRTWTATDNCGNSTQGIQTISVTDTQAPVLSGVPANVTVQCDAIPAPATPTATDNCDSDVSVNLDQSSAPGNCPDASVITRLWFATDNCGNSTVGVQIITVIDTQAPVLSGVPADVTVQCNSIPAPATPTATDNCDTDVTITFDEINNGGNCATGITITRTWTATDNCGNSTQLVQIITAQDNDAPVLVGVPSGVTVECNAVPAPAQPTATDFCDTDVTVTFNETTTPGNCPDNYTITRTWTATDDCGNTAEGSQTITVQDTQLPVLTGIPADLTVNCGNVPAPATPTATDNCDNDVAITFGETTDGANCAVGMLFTRTWTATDNCGNSTQGVQTILLIDNGIPVISGIPANVTVECSAIPAPGQPTATDDCDSDVIITLAETTTAGSCLHSYTLTRTWTATDDCGNTVQGTQLITVQDTQAPIFVDVPANVTVQCNAVPAAATVTSTDNCDPVVSVTFAETITNGNCPDAYTITRVWTATDECNNTAQATQLISVIDTQAPVLSGVPANVTVACNGIPQAGTVTATDNCDLTVSVVPSDVITAGNCPESYTITRTWTATDNCGNTAQATQVITVQDTQGPTWTSLPGALDQTVNCGDVMALAAAQALLPQALDNCDATLSPEKIPGTFVPGDCPQEGTYTNTFTVVDNCGNVSVQYIQVITVVDNLAPQWTTLQGALNVTLECDDLQGLNDAQAMEPVATDNCAINVVLQKTDGPFTPGACAQAGVYVNTWTASDGCGNISPLFIQTITVVDTEQPTLSCPGNVTVNTDAGPVGGLQLTPNYDDNCGVEHLTYTVSGATIAVSPSTGINDASSLLYNPGVSILTYVVHDGCGNTVSCQTTIEVITDTPQDNFILTINGGTAACGQTIVVPVTVENFDSLGSIQFSIGWDPLILALDSAGALNPGLGIGGNFGLAQVSNGFISFGWLTDNIFLGTSLPDNAVLFNLYFSAVVPAGGSSNVVFGNFPTDQEVLDPLGTPIPTIYLNSMVMLGDNLPPSIVCPPDTTVNAFPGECSIFFPLPLPEVVSICGSVESIVSSIPTNIFVAGINNVVYTVTDDNGNSSTCSLVVTVIESLPPQFFNCPANITVFAPNSSCWRKVNWVAPIATDPCNQTDLLIESNYAPGDTFYIGTEQVLYTVTDLSGNMDTCSFTVTVLDTTPPSLVCQPDITVAATGADCEATVDYQLPSANDCDANPQVSGNYDPGDVFPAGTTTVIYTAVDSSGNSSTCSFNILVLDGSPPVITCPANIIVPSESTVCGADVTWSPATATDLCSTGNVVVTSNLQPGFFPVGVTTVIYTAVDVSGNSTFCAFTVTVEETAPPVWSACPGNIVINLPVNDCDTLVNWTVPTATDNCALDTVFSNALPGIVFSPGTSTVVYTAIDESGNAALCTFTITVNELTAPVLSSCPTDTIISNGGGCDGSYTWTMPTATDNCDQSPAITSNYMPGDTFPLGTTTVIINVTDDAGNTASCSFTVTVQGGVPGFTGAPTNQTLTGCIVTATWIPPVPTGFCGPVTLTSNYAPGDTFPPGITTVVYTATDAFGNSATVSFTITVSENTMPVFNCPQSPITVDVAGNILNDPDQFLVGINPVNSCDSVELDFDAPSATDDCGVPVVSLLSGLPAGSAFPVGSNLLIYQAMDASGNQSGCPVTIDVLPFRVPGVDVGPAIGCEGDTVTITVPPIAGATYIWTGPGGPYPNTNVIVVNGLSTSNDGIYTVQLSLNGCLSALDTAEVIQAILPEPIDDNYSVEPNALLDSFNVLLNDTYLLDDWNLTVISAPAGLTYLNNGYFSYQAGEQQTEITFFYELCSKACPDLCNMATVRIKIADTRCEYIPNIITPNDDGSNDYLIIPCVDGNLYPNNRLVVYNQWGDKVYEVSPYVNDPDKAWRGTLKGEPGKNLPDATYFFVFSPDPSDKPIKGYLEIFR